MAATFPVALVLLLAAGTLSACGSEIAAPTTLHVRAQGMVASLGIT